MHGRSVRSRVRISTTVSMRKEPVFAAFAMRVGYFNLTRALNRYARSMQAGSLRYAQPCAGVRDGIGGNSWRSKRGQERQRGFRVQRADHFVLAPNAIPRPLTPFHAQWQHKIDPPIASRTRTPCPHREGRSAGRSGCPIPRNGSLMPRNGPSIPRNRSLIPGNGWPIPWSRRPVPWSG